MAGRRRRRVGSGWDMGGIVAREPTNPVSGRPDVAFLIACDLDPESRTRSVWVGRTRNGSIPPSLDRRRRLGRRLRSFDSVPGGTAPAQRAAPRHESASRFARLPVDPVTRDHPAPPMGLDRGRHHRRTRDRDPRAGRRSVTVGQPVRAGESRDDRIARRDRDSRHDGRAGGDRRAGSPQARSDRRTGRDSGTGRPGRRTRQREAGQG